jgi:hypothetical protein
VQLVAEREQARREVVDDALDPADECPVIVDHEDPQ